MKQEVLPPVEETVGAGALAPPLSPRRSISIFRKRIRKFKTLKRGYYSFVILLIAYGISFLLPLLINNQALIVHYHGGYYFPIVSYHPASQFGQITLGEPDYRALKRELAPSVGDWVLMPPYPYSATESLLDLPGSPPHRPSRDHIFGTDDRARDVFARLAYGFNVSLTFALLVLGFSYIVGVFVGAVIGYSGGKLDILGQRAIE